MHLRTGKILHSDLQYYTICNYFRQHLDNVASHISLSHFLMHTHTSICSKHTTFSSCNALEKPFRFIIMGSFIADCFVNYSVVKITHPIKSHNIQELSEHHKNMWTTLLKTFYRKAASIKYNDTKESVTAKEYLSIIISKEFFHMYTRHASQFGGHK